MPVPPKKASRTEDALEAIDRILETLPLANDVFNAPSSIDLGESETIALRLSTQGPIAELKQEVTEAGARVGARIRISAQMEARLTGQHFNIQAVTPEVQAISRNETTTWKWEVEPTDTGRQRLHLTLTALLDVQGRESKRTVRTFERTLAIDISLSDRVSNFLAGNWQWLWTAILVPAGVWYANRRKKKRAHQGDADDGGNRVPPDHA